jgi:hypothetical protein
MNKLDVHVHLMPNELEYLSGAIFLTATQRNAIRGVERQSPASAHLKLSRGMAEELREAFTEQLAKVGFDEAYRPTAEGKILEELIDSFLGS